MPAPLPEHIQCTKCNQIKPRKEFKRRLTPREMRRYGKSGESGTVMTVLSTKCKACQPKRKRIESLGLAELQRMKRDGAEFHRTTEYKLEALIEKAKAKDDAANQSRSLKLRQHHARTRLEPKLKTLGHIIHKLRVRISISTQSPQKKTYLKRILEYAVRTRDFMKVAIEQGEYREWVQLNPNQFLNNLAKEELRELTDLYNQIPERERAHMKTIY